MGFAITSYLAKLGAEIILITGPSSLEINHKNVKRIDVLSSQEMYDHCLYNYPRVDVAIMSAAVADFTPVQVSGQKIKEKSDHMIIELKPTRDILKQMGKIKNPGQVLVGFALETENELNKAASKLKNKNLDFIVLNSLKDNGAGFGYNTNKVSFIDKNNNIHKFELKSKQVVAKDIIKKLIEFL